MTHIASVAMERDKVPALVAIVQLNFDHYLELNVSVLAGTSMMVTILSVNYAIIVASSAHFTDLINVILVLRKSLP